MIENLCEYIYNLIPQKDVPKKYIGDMPSLTDVGVSFAIADGTTTTTYFGNQEVLLRPNLRCFVRTKSYKSGATLVQYVYDKLQGYHDDTILGITIQGATNYLGKNEEKLHEFQTDYTILVLEKE